MNTAERFARFVEPEPNSGCWLWTGTGERYGNFRIGPRRLIRAHRAAWEMAHGEIPDGLSVLHRCDTPRCVNPAHLRLGTQSDNMREAADRQRWAPVRPWLWGLTTEQRAEIRRRLATERQKDLAAEYGVDRGTIRDSVGTVKSIRGKSAVARLSYESATAIRQRYAAGGVTQSALARDYGVHQSLISLVLNGKAWAS